VQPPFTHPAPQQPRQAGGLSALTPGMLANARGRLRSTAKALSSPAPGAVQSPGRTPLQLISARPAQPHAAAPCRAEPAKAARPQHATHCRLVSADLCDAKTRLKPTGAVAQAKQQLGEASRAAAALLAQMQARRAALDGSDDEW